MKLTNRMREAVIRRILEKVDGPRRQALLNEQHALALRIIKHHYGDDIFQRCRELPEGWLPHLKLLRLDDTVYRIFPKHKLVRHGTVHENSIYQIELADYAPLPYDAQSRSWTRDEIGTKLWDDLHELACKLAALGTELEQLHTQLIATLNSFTTVEKLADGWPEGYAELPQELLAQTGGVPAPRIMDLNIRIEAMQKAA